MIVAVFGATGMMGKELVKQSLFKDYKVRAYGRNVHTTNFTQSDNLEVIKGTLFDNSQVLKALRGVDAVLSALGGGADGSDKTRSLGIKSIISQMQIAGVKRIVSIGGVGILPDNSSSKMLMDRPNFHPEYKMVSEEYRSAYYQLRESGLDWTIMAPTEIKEAPPTGDYVVAKDNLPTPDNQFVNSGDLALFMVNELTRNNYLYSRVGISGK